MKKIKLLTPILAISTLTPMIALVSCGNPEGDVTKHVHVTTQADPVVGDPFVLTFTLDDNYSLNIADSSITFGSANDISTVGLSKCIISSDAKTIIVPGEFVTDTKATLNVISEKQTKVTKDEQKQIIANFMNSYVNKNVTYSGELNGKFYKATDLENPETWTYNGYINGSYDYYLNKKNVKTIIHTKMYNAEGKETQDNNSTSFSLEDENGIGFWCLSRPNEASEWTASPSPVGGLQLHISEFDFTLDKYVDSLKYDSVQNVYIGTFYDKDNWYLGFNFYLSNDKKSVKSFEIVENVAMKAGQQEYWTVGSSSAFCTAKDEGRTQFDIPSSFTKQSVFGSDKIVYDDASSSYKHTLQSTAKFTSNVRIELQLDKFGSDKKTYIKIDSNSDTGSFKHANDVIFLGSKKLVKGTDWNIVERNGFKVVEINKINTTDKLYCVSEISSDIQTNNVTSNDTFDAITIWQENN